MVSRRGFLWTAAAAVAGGSWVVYSTTRTGAVGAVPAPTGGAGAGWMPVGTAVRKPDRARIRQARAGVTHLSVSWPKGTDHVQLGSGPGWGTWTGLESCGGAPDSRPARLEHVVVNVPAGHEYSVTSAAEVIELSSAAGRALAAPILGMPLPDGSTCPVTYLTRAAWGANEAWRFSDGVEVWPAEWHPVQVLTVHHTASSNNDPDPAATVRAIYHDQAVIRDGGWGDIGYHLLIDEAGRVYEGRWTGTGGVPVFGQRGSGSVNTAGHAYGFNHGNIGVCLLGNFTGTSPTAAARDALVNVLAGLARVGRLDPLATIVYRRPDTGETRTVPSISGHRDFAATACPGDTFYPELGSLRSAVAARMTPPDRDRPAQSTPPSPPSGRTPPAEPSPPTATRQP